MLLKVASTWDTNPRRISFSSAMDKRIMGKLLSCQHFYRGAITIHSWNTFKRIKKSALENINGNWQARPSLHRQVNLDLISEEYDESMHNVLIDHFLQDSKMEDLWIIGNLIKKALTPEEYQLVELLFAKGNSSRWRISPKLRTKKWKREVISLIKKSELRPKNLKTLFSKNNQNLDRVKYKISRKVADYYEAIGIKTKLLSPWMYPCQPKKIRKLKI
jgi:hypothetical protein